MAFKFKFRNERIILDETFFMFQEFIDIWKSDKSEDKSKANAMLRFISLLCDIADDNPLKDVHEDKKEEEALFRAFKSRTKVFTKKEYDLIQPAILKYTKLNLRAEEVLLGVFDEKSEQIISILEKTNPETCTNVDNGVVTFVSNSKILTDTLSKLSTIRKNRESIVASIKNEAMSERVRGAMSLSPLDQGLIKINT